MKSFNYELWGRKRNERVCSFEVSLIVSSCKYPNYNQHMSFSTHGDENSFEAYKAMRSLTFYKYNNMYNTICLIENSMIVLLSIGPKLSINNLKLCHGCIT